MDCDGKHVDEESGIVVNKIHDSGPTTGEGNDSKTVVLNVGGKCFETYASTLKRIPNTRLANLEQNGRYFNREKNEYFFDRNPTVFEAVLEFYRTGELHSPLSICGPQVKREFKFWGIDQRDLERCCWNNYYGSADTRDNLIAFEESMEKFMKDPNKKGCPSCMETVWMFLDNPKSSVGAMIFAVISQLVILLSVLSLILESIHSIQVPIDSYDNDTLLIIPGIRQSGDTTVPSIKLLYVDWFCYLFFIVEYITRFVFCPKKKWFFTDGYCIIDFLAILPPVIFYIGYLANPVFSSKENFKITLRALESLRVLRLMHIMRFIHSGQVVLYSLRKSMKEVGLTILLFLIGVTCCGSLMYYAEKDNVLNFLEIPTSLWWAIVTMTTVGYGDMYPTGPWGYVVGTITMMIGILLVGLTFSTIVNNFMLYFGHEPIADTHECPRSYAPPRILEVIYNEAIYHGSASAIDNTKSNEGWEQKNNSLTNRDDNAYVNSGYIKDDENDPDVINTRL